ncbi:MAG: hypothetical protein ACI4E2_04120, partial [Acetatifactor sp.]
LAASASLRRRSNQTEPHPATKGYSTLSLRKKQAFFSIFLENSLFFLPAPYFPGISDTIVVYG